MKTHNTFNVVSNGSSFTFSIIGYDHTKIHKEIHVWMEIDKIIDTMKNRGDFKYESDSDYAEMIVEEAWKHHIHLEYDCPTYGTYCLTE